MLLLLTGVLLYFLPSILGHDKRDAAGIFLLNFFLGWTVIGWIAAMVWACTSEPVRPVLVLASPGRYCTSCGTPCVTGGRFCSACGRPL